MNIGLKYKKIGIVNKAESVHFKQQTIFIITVAWIKFN